MFEKEIEVGKNAVIEAMRITAIIQKELQGEDSISKSDNSPVTIADFTSQAILCRILKDYFPRIPIVAEESSDELKKPENHMVLHKIFKYIETDSGLQHVLNRDNLFDSIDLGNQSTASLFWTLDPIDGTKGFLRGEQFSIALALIVDGEVKLGILGCPNLQLKNNLSNRGFVFLGEKNRGTMALNLQTQQIAKICVSNVSSPRKMKFVQSYESSHSNMELQHAVARNLKLENPPVQMDSQVKYGIVASGNAEIYLRIPNPKTPDYKEKIWDHAAGSIIVEEAGGVATDIYGEKLDFSAGKTLNNNTGILVSVPSIHKSVLSIIQEFHN